MKRIKTYIILILPIALNSCVAYYPQVVDIPLIEKKGDLRINAGLATPASFLSAHGTVSYGLTNTIATQVYGSIDLYSRYNIQGAVGYFKKLKSENIIELYGGYGYGNSFDFGDEYFNNHLVFAQFNIGKTNQGKLNLDYGFSLKGGHLYVDYIKPWCIPRSASGLMLEPSAFFRFGSERMKVGFQFNYLYTKIVEDIHYLPFSVGMSVNFNISTR
ncbi:MAG: hypothetical protein FWE63_08395 [Bacteroidales bacterium]|nr:hypothetical protein [Bacteroidales bacterium]